MAIYITGDTHGNFRRIKNFCFNKASTTYNDILIILGDAGINYFLDERDTYIKELIDALPITLFCIHGNHEIRPEHISSYKEMQWNNGSVFVEDLHPNILFAKDGETYDIDGIKTFVCGGAYSVDKYYRIQNNMLWVPDEQPSDKIKAMCEQKLYENKWDVDVILTHTCPDKYTPRETFLPFIKQDTVDRSTEYWLDYIEDMTHYKKWYCGHFHTDKTIDKMRFLFEDIVKFGV